MLVSGFLVQLEGMNLRVMARHIGGATGDGSRGLLYVKGQKRRKCSQAGADF